MKKIYHIIIIILLIPISSNAQWLWSNNSGGNSFNYPNDRPSSLINDGLNSYLIGIYGGPLYMPNDTLPANGVNQIFISKFDAAGTQQWAKSIGGNFNQFTEYEYGMGIYSEKSNSLYITGQVIGTVSFGGIILTGSNNPDIFLTKMDLNGNFIWALKEYGAINDIPLIFENKNGKIYMIAQTNGVSTFGSFTLPACGGIVTYDSSGTCLTATDYFTPSAAGMFNRVSIKFIETDMINYGSFSTPTFRIDTDTLIKNGVSDAFLSRADSNGNLKWVKQFGYSGVDYINDLVVSNNSLYAVGGFQDSITFNSTTLYNNGTDIFIAKFDTSGNIIWVRNLSCTGNTNLGNALTVDADGNSYITGAFSGTATFGSFQITASSSSDMFLARYDSSGNCLGVKNFGQASGSCLATDNAGDVTVAGTFTNTVTIGSNTFTSYGGKDVFLAKTIAITGIEEERITSNQLIIYANPTAGKCTITVPDEFINEPYLQLTILDNSGKIIQQKTVEMNDGKIKLNLEAEAKGMYHVTLGNGKKKYSGKIVFE